MGKLQQQVTTLSNADQLRALIDSAERILRIDAPEPARDLLATLHEAHRMADQFERDAPDIDLRPEQARLDALDERVLRNARPLVRALGGMEAFEQYRQQFAPQPDEIWWQLDARIAEERRKSLRRLAITGIVVAVLAVIVFLARDILFPYNPVSDAVNNAGVRLDAGDIPAAQAEIDAGLQVVPTSTELLIWKGIVLQLSGDAAGSEQAFDQARQNARNEIEFYLQRGQSYIRVARFDDVIADADAVLAINPDSAEAYYLRATGYEAKGDMFQAVQDVDKSAQLAQAAGNDSLYALARYRYAMMMQAGVGPTATPTP